jgi:ComF family protein
LLGTGDVSLATDLLDLIFPPACVSCAELLETRGPYCALCALGLEPVPRPGCPRCAEPDPAGTLCRRCRLRLPPFVNARAAFVHEGPLARAIHRFKYEGRSELASPLGRALAEAEGGWLASVGPGALLVPIPLHRGRLLRRGYDQAALLARSLASATGLRLELGLLRRGRATRRQVGLSEGQRLANVAGAFTVVRPVPARPLVLVDDVFTTGATARAASAALLENGAGVVHVLTLARAVGWE